jgi:hypothetical protein
LNYFLINDFNSNDFRLFDQFNKSPANFNLD